MWGPWVMLVWILLHCEFFFLICGVWWLAPGNFENWASKIEFESHFSSISKYLLSTEYINFLIAGWELSKPSEIESKGDFSSLLQWFKSYTPSNHWKLDPLILNFRMISASLYWIAILSDCWKILGLNLRVISAVITVFIPQDLSNC